MNIRIYSLILICLLLSYGAVSGQDVSDTLHSATIQLESDTSTTSSTTINGHTDDDFSPGMLFFALIGIGLVAICVGIGVAIVALGLLLVFGLIGLGVLSTSILVGLSTSSLTKGFKTFLLFSTSILGLGIGAISLYLLNKLFELELEASTAILYGSISGLLGGVVLGYLSFNLIIRLTHFFKQRIGYV